MKRYQKGQYGYRNYRRKRELIKVLLGALLILLQLGLRQFTANEGLKNLLTVSAILSVLPAANIASPLLASWKVKTPGEAFYQQIRSYEKNAILLYDLILTSREMILPVDAAAITSGKALLYCKPKKGREDGAKRFLKEMFCSHQLDLEVVLIGEEGAFFRRLEQLRKEGEKQADDSKYETLTKAAALLKNLSM